MDSPATEPAPQTPATAAPRVVVFVFDCARAQQLQAFLAGLGRDTARGVEQLVVMLERPDSALPSDYRGAGVPGVELKFHRPPRPLVHGAARKAAFEYALRNGFDLAVCASASGEHPPDAIARVLAPALEQGAEVVLGAPPGRLQAARRVGVPAGRWLAARAIGRVLNAILGMAVPDYHAGLRVYSTRLLRCAPFHFNDDGPLFDVHLLLQCRALGLSVESVPVEETAHGSLSPAYRLAEGLRACASAVAYRLHQLHLVRRGRYFVDLGVHYTLKSSPTSSHMQIVDAIAPGSRVLDLGCSQGLLSRPLREKNVTVVGVDSGEHAHIADELEAYHRHDLETPLRLPHGRDFDYVVVADVIEHIVNRTVLLRSARRFLKPDGRALISTPNIALWFYRLSLLLGRFEYGPRGVLDYTHVHLFTRDSFRREVEAAGFRVLREWVTALPFEVVFQSTGRSRLVGALGAAYHALARLWPEMFAYQFILEVEIITLDEDSTQDAPAAGAPSDRGRG